MSNFAAESPTDSDGQPPPPVDFIQLDEEEEEDEYYEEEDDYDFDEEEDEDNDEEEELEEDDELIDDPPRVSQDNASDVPDARDGGDGDDGGEAPSSSQGYELNRGEIEGLFCPICMDAWTSEGDHHICCLPCGHLYGMSCIKKWLQQKRSSAKCPQCNRKCGLKDVRKLFGPKIVVIDIDEQSQKRFRCLESKCESLEKKGNARCRKEAELRIQIRQLTERTTNLEGLLAEKESKQYEVGASNGGAARQAPAEAEEPVNQAPSRYYQAAPGRSRPSSRYAQPPYWSQDTIQNLETSISSMVREMEALNTSVRDSSMEFRNMFQSLESSLQARHLEARADWTWFKENFTPFMEHFGLGQALRPPPLDESYRPPPPGHPHPPPPDPPRPSGPPHQ